MRGGRSELVLVVRTVEVNEAAVSSGILGFESGRPKNAAQDEVLVPARRPNFARRDSVEAEGRFQTADQ